MAKKCEDCEYLRTDVRFVVDEESALSAKYGRYTNPCNRYPQNIMCAPKEPACGEFKPKGATP